MEQFLALFALKSSYCVAYIDVITFITFMYHFHLLNVVSYPNEVMFNLFVIIFFITNADNRSFECKTQK